MLAEHLPVQLPLGLVSSWVQPIEDVYQYLRVLYLIFMHAYKGRTPSDDAFWEGRWFLAASFAISIALLI